MMGTSMKAIVAELKNGENGGGCEKKCHGGRIDSII